MEADVSITNEAFVSCVISRKGSKLAADLPITLEGFEDRPEKIYPIFWRTLIIHCHDSPTWAGSGSVGLTLVLSTGGDITTLDQQVSVHAIPQESGGAIGACVAPYVTARPTTVDWLMHHRALGVSSFYMYLPEGGALDHQVERSKINELRMKFPPVAFYSSALWWLHYYPHARSHYYGQVITYNHCIFLNRRRHEFLLTLDVDEFISVAGQQSLLSLLQATLPESHAGVLFPIAWHGVSCQAAGSTVSYDGKEVLDQYSVVSDMDQFRDENRSQWWINAKGAIRPLNVLQQHVHQPLKVTPAVAKKAWMQHLEPTEAIIRHVRCTAHARAQTK